MTTHPTPDHWRSALLALGYDPLDSYEESLQWISSVGPIPTDLNSLLRRFRETWPLLEIEIVTGTNGHWAKIEYVADIGPKDDPADAVVYALAAMWDAGQKGQPNE